MANERDHGLGWGVLIGAVGMLVVLALIGLGVVFTGAYDVAATDPHSAFARWALSTTMDNSVKQRAASITAAENITPAMIAAGARTYHEACEHCHAAPGVQRDPWAEGMLPKPPHLTDAAKEWSLPQVFWIAKHGIKMSGMPAFGPKFDDAKLWGIAAFVKSLPTMTPQTYAQMGGGPGGSADSGGGGK